MNVHDILSSEYLDEVNHFLSKKGAHFSLLTSIDENHISFRCFVDGNLNPSIILSESNVIEIFVDNYKDSIKFETSVAFGYINELSEVPSYFFSFFLKRNDSLKYGKWVIKDIGAYHTVLYLVYFPNKFDMQAEIFAEILIEIVSEFKNFRLCQTIYNYNWGDARNFPTRQVQSGVY